MTPAEHAKKAEQLLAGREHQFDLRTDVERAQVAQAHALLAIAGLMSGARVDVLEHRSVEDDADALSDAVRRSIRARHLVH
jgi:hypothetical protein